LVDRLHSWYTDQDDIFSFHPMALELSSVQFYDSMVASEKKPEERSVKNSHVRNGVITESCKVVQARNRRSVF